MRLIAIQTSGIIELLSKCFSTKGDKARDDADNIKMRCFMTAILAYLPFNHLGDVLFPLYSISEIVALEGNEIAQNLKDILVSNGFADAEIDPNYIDDVEKAVGKKKNPSRTKTLAVMRKAAQFDTSSLFSQLCFQGCSFVVVSSSIFLSVGSIQRGVGKRLVDYELPSPPRPHLLISLELYPSPKETIPLVTIYTTSYPALTKSRLVFIRIIIIYVIIIHIIILVISRRLSQI